MTPFGQRMRELRRQHNISLKHMAADLGVSSAYLSALEHGHRGRPTFLMIQQICNYFNIIWDEAEELQRLADLSHPRVTIDTSGLSPKATRLANRLAVDMASLSDAALDHLLAYLAAEENK